MLKPLYSRILTICLALAFLPVLVSVSTDADSFSRSRNGTAPHAAIENLTELLCSKEFLPLRTTHIHRSHTGRGAAAPRHFQLWFRSLLQLFFAVCILYLTLRLFGRSFTYSQRCIIRYIHHQDGQKGGASVHLYTILHLNGGYRNENSSHCDTCHRHSDGITHVLSRLAERPVIGQGG